VLVEIDLDEVDKLVEDRVQRINQRIVSMIQVMENIVENQMDLIRRNLYKLHL
jgi:hypothetical protein